LQVVWVQQEKAVQVAKLDEAYGNTINLTNSQLIAGRMNSPFASDFYFLPVCSKLSGDRHPTARKKP
jgi:hypothetical protein